MNFDLLGNHLHEVPKVARWYLDEWGHLVPGARFEDVLERIEANYLNRDRLPLIICGFEKGILAGVCQLKFHEMTIYPDYEHWLGGVYVSNDRRSRGLGSSIVKQAVKVAAGRGVETLYLQTEDLSGGIYAELGWSPVEQVNYEGIDVLVMKRQIRR